jgi:hypothetical protein
MREISLENNMRWRPAHQAHAIERCTVTFEFAEPISSKLWRDHLERISGVAVDLGFGGRIDELEPAQVAGRPGVQSFGSIQIPPGAPPNLLAVLGAQSGGAGRILQRVDEVGLREEIALRRNHFLYATYRYAGWVALWQQLQRLFEDPFSTILTHVDLKLTKLEYWDRFILEGPVDDAAYAELLRFGTTYLPTFPAGTTELWHSHIGLYVPVSSEVRRLLNVNVDVFDGPEAGQADQPAAIKRSVGMYLLVQDTASDGSLASFVAAQSSFDSAHSLLKDVMAAIITHPMTERIALFSGEE